MSEIRPETSSAVDPIARLRTALDRLAFALDCRKTAASVVSAAPEAIPPEPNPAVLDAIAGLDALMLDVRSVLAGLRTPEEASHDRPLSGEEG